jgi:hypothetical protein
MSEQQVSRTLVKSAPELWAECSDAASLARHLGRFGEIKITKLEPETAVAWEGDDVRGTVTLEPAGWGTKVTLTASATAPPVAEAPATEPESESQPEPLSRPPEPEPEPEPEPAAAADHRGPTPADAPPAEPQPAGGFLSRLKGLFRGRVPDAAPERDSAPPAAEPPVRTRLRQRPNGPESASASPDDPLTLALDSLGMAHHRPYSRS